MEILSRYLDETIDQIAVDEDKLFPVRITLAIITCGILAANINTSVALLFFILSVGMEIYGRIVIQPLLRGGSPSVRERLLYLSAILLISGAWIVPSVVYWSTGKASLQIIAILSLNAQLIHAQAFLYRSSLVLVPSAAIPALAMLVLLGGYSDFGTVEMISVTLAYNGVIGYVLVSVYKNVTGTRLLEQSRSDYQKLANTDGLTGLPNRRRFTELLRSAISSDVPGGCPFSLLIIDLDKFKSINDTIGHDAGDAVLVEAARRLRQVVGEAGTVARLGGDEFAILLTCSATASAALYDKVVAAFLTPTEFAGVALRTGASIGVARFPQDATTEEELFKCADLALYDVKRAGGRGWSFAAAAPENVNPLQAPSIQPSFASMNSE